MVKTTRRKKSAAEIQRMRARRRNRNSKITTGKVAKIAKSVVVNNMEMLRRETGPIHTSYMDRNREDPPTDDEEFHGLNARNPCNFTLHPLNYGWENDESSSAIDHFTGNGIQPRYLKTKLLYQFPGGANAIINPVRLQLVWGFIKKPFLLTQYTTPNRDSVETQELKDIGLHQVEDQFDSFNDQLKFHIKKPSNMVIVGRKWLKPDRRHRIGAPQHTVLNVDGTVDPRSTGAPPQIKETISWKMGPQWRLRKTTQESGNVYWYNNEQYVPFWVTYFPDFGEYTQASGNDPGTAPGGGEDGDPVPEENRIHLTHNSCMWYTDA